MSEQIYENIKQENSALRNENAVLKEELALANQQLELHSPSEEKVLILL